ncbi:HalOD1 output domain-containing protein [Halegenticoccus soli]|uniref:HalOD1 output domain-containing protein n=1 Tax=Halegenticoccus soli TaxID=1985678 RepID=UPI000C6E6744|nr:HalOD1 output domain-containing protein [Halegenticoccus soli]
MIPEHVKTLRTLGEGERGYLVRYSVDEGEPFGTAIVEAVEAIDPGGSIRDEPLDVAVDADALDNLFGAQYDGTPRGDGVVVFEHWGLLIVVETSGAVFVYDAPEGGPPSAE